MKLDISQPRTFHNDSMENENNVCELSNLFLNIYSFRNKMLTTA